MLDIMTVSVSVCVVVDTYYISFFDNWWAFNKAWASSAVHVHYTAVATYTIRLWIYIVIIMILTSDMLRTGINDINEYILWLNGLCSYHFSWHLNIEISVL